MNDSLPKSFLYKLFPDSFPNVQTVGSGVAQTPAPTSSTKPSRRATDAGCGVSARLPSGTSNAEARDARSEAAKDTLGHGTKSTVDLSMRLEEASPASTAAGSPTTDLYESTPAQTNHEALHETSQIGAQSGSEAAMPAAEAFNRSATFGLPNEMTNMDVTAASGASALSERTATGTVGLTQTVSSGTTEAAAGDTTLTAGPSTATFDVTSLMYPYQPLHTRAATYRGYPIDGTQGLKRKGWKIQLTSPEVGPPAEPLPQFPQQEILSRSAKGYSGCEAVPLSEEEVRNNSGEAFRVDADGNQSPGPSPSSAWFYTASYRHNQTIKLYKATPGSIYHDFIAGRSVPVTVAATSSKP